MDQSIVSIFDDYSQAEEAVQTLQENGYENKISVFMTNRDNVKLDLTDERKNDDTGMLGSLGAFAGVTLGVISYAVPGLSPIMAGGPLFGLADGNVRGEFLDSLTEEGYEDDKKQYIMDELKQGKIMIVVHGEYGDLPAAHQIVTCLGGSIVDTGNINTDQLKNAYQLDEFPIETQADDVIPIPAHLIDEDSYIDPNIGYGDHDLVAFDQGLKKDE